MGAEASSLSCISDGIFLFWFFFFFFFWEMKQYSGIEMGMIGLGVFIVVFSDEMFSSLLPTSSDEFQFCHKRSQNLLCF